MYEIGQQVATNNGKLGKITNVIEPDSPYSVHAYELLVTHKYDSTKRSGKVVGWIDIKPYTQVFNQRFIERLVNYI